jgi:hypothetical protein
MLMFFTTAPFNLSPAEKKQGYKDESKHIWAFQNTWSQEFPTRVQCRLAGAHFVDEILPVATMNVKGWCICIGDNDTECPPIPAVPHKKTPAVAKLSEQLEQLRAAPGVSPGATVTFEPIGAN